MSKKIKKRWDNGNDKPSEEPSVSPDRRLPTHVCPRCGEWYDVTYDPNERLFYVEVHDPEGILMSKIWSETTSEPVCPSDAVTLQEWLIDNESELVEA